MNRKPNILLFLPDQHRGDWLEYPQHILEALGQPELKLETPNIRGLMERGTSFLSAWSPCPTCAPARACLAAAVGYRNCRVQDNNICFDPTMHTFYQVLRDGGYQVGSVGKLDLNKPNKWWSNTEEWMQTLRRIGFTAVVDSEGKGDGVTGYAFGSTPGPYLCHLRDVGWADAHVKDILDRANSDKPTPLPDAEYGDNWVGQCGLDMIRGFDREQPWFLQVNFPGPHNPWDVTESMKREYQDRVYPAPVGEGKRPPHMNGILQNYAAMIHNIDRNVGLYLELLRERGELENTIVVYASDHGEMMGDFGRFHKNRPEQGSVRIPMVIDASCMGAVQNRFTEAPAALEDLAATFVDYAGLKPDKKWQAKSLRPILEGKAERVRDYVTSDYIYLVNREVHLPYVGSWHAVTDGRWKLTEFDNVPTALFDLKSDPRELNNLLDREPEHVARLRQAFVDSIPRGRHILAEAEEKAAAAE